MTIKAVLFDLGGTLVYSRPEETFQKILGAHGIVEPLDRVKQALTRANQQFDIDRHNGLPANEVYAKWNMVALSHLGIEEELRQRKLADVITSRWFEFAVIHAYPEVKSTLQKLRRMGCKLGILTGGFEEDIAQIVPKAGLEGLFDVCVGADTIGKRKPNPMAFTYACEKLEKKPHESIFVGDRLDVDYLGSEKAGLIPVLIRRQGPPVSGIRTIKRLDEIFQILKQFNP